VTKKSVIITIDGPSASGKSTVAKLVAKELKFVHLDTGAIYRSIAWWIKEKQLNVNNTEGLIEALEDFSYKVVCSNNTKGHFVNNVDVTKEIRRNEIADLASQISAIPEIREISNEFQRKIGKDSNIVVEGRDAGSVVFPGADFKFFLIANANERAKRRFIELKKKYPEEANSISIEKVTQELKERDERDRFRKHSPLKRSFEAITIDTTNLTPEKITNKVVKTTQKGLKKKRAIIWTWLLNNELAQCNFWYKFSYLIAHWIFRIFYRIKVYGIENVPEGKAIIAPNHSSFLDPPAVGTTLPFESHSLAQKYLFKIPVLKKLLPKLCSHPVTGTAVDKEVIKTVVSVLIKGKKVLIFPEGARSKDGKIAPLKKGIGLIASMANCPVVPTIIVGAYKIWPRSKRFPKPWGKISVVYGKPLVWEDYLQKYKSRKDAQDAFVKDLEIVLIRMLANFST